MPDATDFVAACSRARDAQRDWAATPAPRRGRAIQQIGRIVEANKEALARVMTGEMGKPIAESRGEVQEVIDTCDFFLGEGRRLASREPSLVVARTELPPPPSTSPRWYRRA